MWALRRVSSCTGKQELNTGSTRLCFATSELSNRCFEDRKTGVNRTTTVVSDRSLSIRRFCKMVHSPPTPFKGSCSFFSQEGTKIGGGEDYELNGISDLEFAIALDSIQERSANNDDDDDLVSEPEPFDEDAEGLQSEIGGTETHISLKKAPSSEIFEAILAAVPPGGTVITQKKAAPSEILKAILAAFPLSVDSVMDKWVEEGKKLTRSDIRRAILGLRKRHMYVAALKWLESSKHIDFTDRDYASQVNLIAKVCNLRKAEAYIEKIPKSFRSEIVYRTLLANCVSVFDVNKSEEVFKKMKDLKFPISCFTFNQLLLLYKRTDKKMIADVVSLMEKEHVKPNPDTYKILIDAKGESNDIVGMEQVFEAMKAEGIEPDFRVKGSLVRHYICGGLYQKAEAVLKEMEGVRDASAYVVLLPLYAALGKADEVRRIWQQCESNPQLSQCIAAIEAWGKLKKIDEAEAVFDTMLNKFPNLSSRAYSALLNVYANNKMAKGEELVKRMTENCCHIGSSTWESIVKLYIEAGEVEKADSILDEASTRKCVKPMFRSYIAIMDQYAEKGDIHNSEKIFHRMGQAGLPLRFHLYKALIQAYMNAKSPAYGMYQRVMGDQVFPKREMAAMLYQVDPFKSEAILEILE